MAAVESDWVRHLASQRAAMGPPVVRPTYLTEVYVHPQIPFGWSVMDVDALNDLRMIVIGRDTWLTLGYDSRSQWAFIDLVAKLPLGANQHDAIDGPLADAVKAKAMLEPARITAEGGADRVTVLTAKARGLLTQAASLNSRSESRQWNIFAREMARLSEEVAELEGNVGELRALVASVQEAYL